VPIPINVPAKNTNINTKIIAQVFKQPSAAGFLDVGSGSNPPGTLPDLTKGNAAGVWGFVGELIDAPKQPSSPPLTCGVFGQSGEVDLTGLTSAGGILQSVNSPVTASSPAAGLAGVVGFGPYGVVGVGSGGVVGIGTGTSGTGVSGSSSNGEGTASGDGVSGFSNTGFGVHATNGQGWNPNDRNMQPATGCGIFAESDGHEGVFGASASAHGVHGVNGVGSGSTPTVGCGVWGESQSGIGVYGETSSQAQAGVSAQNNSAFPCTAMLASSAKGHGVQGVNGVGSGKPPPHGAGVWGDSDDGIGVYGASKNGFAGQFEGAVTIIGDHTVSGNIVATGSVTGMDMVLSGADCAEEFDLLDPEGIEPGSVVIFDAEGALSLSNEPYSKRVAGVISGAGAYRPGVILDRRISARARVPVALVGKVYCKVDATPGPIEVGDLLTTSLTPGRAMKAQDPLRAFGAIIGKALGNLDEGFGLIPILVTIA
jgi:hypothetical protein